MDQETKPNEDNDFAQGENNPVQPVMVSDVPELKPVEPEIIEKQKSSNNGVVKVVLVSLLVLLIAASGVAAYIWRDMTANDSEKAKTADIAILNDKITNLEADLLDANSGTVIPDTGDSCCTAVAPSATVIASIKSSITSGNTAALEGYMASAVKVVLAMAEGTAPGTPTEAVTTITDFISSATSPWNFEKTSGELAQYAVGAYGPYFPAIAVVGISANNKVITFDFDCDSKISRVFMASDASILQ